MVFVNRPRTPRLTRRQSRDMAENFASYFERKSFSFDWTSSNFDVWVGLLTERRAEPLRILEIGSWEGRSAVFFLNFLPASKIVCIDTFSGGREHWLRKRLLAALPFIERRFDANLAEFSGRVEKRKAKSIDALGDLALDQRRFDLVYVDGSHAAIDVYRDALLSWAMLNPRGIMILDDYEWPEPLPERAKPRLGVDTFLATLAGGYKELHRGYQVIIAK